MGTQAEEEKDCGTKPEPSLPLTCLMDDLTLAALASALDANRRGVLVKKDELSHWFAAMDQFRDAKALTLAGGYRCTRAFSSDWIARQTRFGRDYGIHGSASLGGFSPRYWPVLTQDFSNVDFLHAFCSQRHRDGPTGGANIRLMSGFALRSSNCSRISTS